MAKKTLKKKAVKKQNPVISSARDIWLAGLGAMAVAQQESGKVIEQGSKLFDRLVKEGGKFEGETRKVAGGAVDDLKDGFDNRFGNMRQQAAENWDKLEKVFEERVARALGRLGVPTADDVQELIDRVQDLAEKVRDAALDTVGKKKPAARVRKATRKPASKAKAKVRAVKKTTRKTGTSAKRQVKKAVKEVKAKAA